MLAVNLIGFAVRDVKPKCVATPMTDGRENMFWVCSAEVDAAQIYAAVVRRKRRVYGTGRWRLMAWVLKALPYRVAWWLEGGAKAGGRRVEGMGFSWHAGAREGAVIGVRGSRCRRTRMPRDYP